MLLDTLRLLAGQLQSADDPRGGRVVRYPCGLWTGRRARSLAAASAQMGGPPDNGKSKRIPQRDLFSWTCQFGRAARSSGTVGGLDEALHAKKRCSEWPASHAGRGHQDGGVGGTSSRRT